ncbi:MAG: MraY family glycosyltransferase [Candidatus Hydrogenedentes bacterium]|nr:MraY family glycosyltransferase [Candidatus Hydrogenedentota bacterium]
MTANWYFVMAVSLAASFLISVLLTDVARRAALRWNFLDQPGERKVHSIPVPLMGGVAIWASFYIVILGTFAVLALMSQYGNDWLLSQFDATFGDNGTVKLTGLLAGGLVIFVLGIVDDLKILSPEVKLAGQIIAALVLVVSGMRIEMFIFRNIWISSALTVLWVVTLTNSLNFLDNMDGLAGGVSVIAAFSFFLAVQPYEQYLVRLVLVVFAGAVAGFLYHNLSPARIFMGDAGAMFCGYLLASVAIMGTFHIASTPSPIAVAAPLLALSVPLFDISSVVFIRWRHGESIMKGDKRHFSHRLVKLGMSPRQAVEFIFLVAAVTGLGGALLSRLGQRGVMIVLAQTLGVYLLIVLLMNAGKKNGDNTE